MFVCRECWEWEQAGHEGSPPTHLHALAREGFVITELYSDGSRKYRTMWGQRLEAERMY